MGELGALLEMAVGKGAVHVIEFVTAYRKECVCIGSAYELHQRIV